MIQAKCKKAEGGITMQKLIVLILVVLVVAASIYALFKSGALDYLKNLPSFNASK